MHGSRHRKNPCLVSEFCRLVAEEIILRAIVQRLRIDSHLKEVVLKLAVRDWIVVKIHRMDFESPFRVGISQRLEDFTLDQHHSSSDPLHANGLIQSEWAVGGQYWVSTTFTQMLRRNTPVRGSSQFRPG